MHRTLLCPAKIMMCRRVERLGASLLLANLSPTALHCQSLFSHCHKTEFSVVHFPRSALDTLVFKSTVCQTLYCTLYKCLLIPISTAASFPHTLQFYLHHILIQPACVHSVQCAAPSRVENCSVQHLAGASGLFPVSSSCQRQQ